MGDEKHCVLIIDAGSQYCKLIDRVVRELGVYTNIVPFNICHQSIVNNNYKAIIISGSPGSVYNETIQFDYKIIELGIPILGICYGMQLLVKKFGGKVEYLDRREDGQTVIRINDTCQLYQNMEMEQTVLLTHGDMCTEIPNYFKINSLSANNVAISISNDDHKIYGIQFHPEVNLTINGSKILHNFIFQIANCKPTYTLQNKMNECINKISNFVQPNSNVIVLVSGGVDSTVSAILVNQALPSHNVKYVFIDNGFLRHGETEHVSNLFKQINLELTVIFAHNEFYNGTSYNTLRNNGVVLYDKIGPLKRTIEPEYKRSIIGNMFITVIKNFLTENQISLDTCIFVQGTLRPDLIESASPSITSMADVIKTHHNDSSFTREMRSKGQVLEPLSDLHKDEVRKLAVLLGLQPNIINRHPFPGPGLAIRILCIQEPTTLAFDSKYDVPSLAEFIANYSKKKGIGPNPIVKHIIDSLSPYDYEQLLATTNGSIYLKATHLPILTVGIQGDKRTYKNVIVLSTDDSNNVNWINLSIIAKIIPKICLSINRVIFAFGKSINESVSLITHTFLTPDAIKTCRNAHQVVNDILQQENIFHSVSQFPIILIPIHFDESPFSLHPPSKRSVVLRPIISSDFMTGIPALPEKHIPLTIVNRMVESLLQIPNISRVLYDLTPKPPGTIEWE